MLLGELDPLLSDQEIIQTFTPLELQFYKWDLNGGMSAVQQREAQNGSDEFDKALEEKWPKEDDVVAKFADFATKWYGRHRRRMRHPVAREDLVRLLSDTNCKNSNQLGKTLWIMNLHNVPDLFVGESNFGGVLTGYAVAIGSHFLWPDVPPRETIDPNNPDLLDYAILAMELGDNPEPEKNSRQSGSSDEETVVWARGADSEGFENRESFCLFQLGSLHYCTGEEWMTVRNAESEERDNAEWEDTGYGVVVQLTDSGHPTGPVYVVYNFHQRRIGVVPQGEENPIWEEIQWRDKMHTELPHIRRLYPGCDEQFFLAKIANKLDDLKEGSSFGFEIIREKRHHLVRAKCVGPDRRIIPNEILAEGQAADAKCDNGRIP